MRTGSKVRYERTIIGEKGFRLSYGAGAEYAHYRNSTYRRVFSEGEESSINYESNLKLGKIGAGAAPGSAGADLQSVP